MVTQSGPPGDGESYERKREWGRQQSRRISAAGRDIGTIPPVEDPERRESCREDLKLFIETYAPELCYLGWAKFHLVAIARLQEVILHRARFALALPRGSGKTTLMRLALWWAVSYAHGQYLFLIGANSQKAEDNLDAIKTWLRFSEPWIYDFPEISHPIRSLEGIAHRCSGQTCNGHPTQIIWAKDRIVLPTVHAPEGSGFSEDSPAATSGLIIGVSGLTGDGIRGSLFTKQDGSLVRPDIALLDDIQTDESATSPTQTDKRLNLVAGAVSGMAGPDKDLACMAGMTVIRPGDAATQLLDRTQFPEWRGETHGILDRLPRNMSAWEAYFEVYARCMQSEPPDFSKANEHYLTHRERLDEGCEASWPERFKKHEVSAIQSAMHLYFRDRRAFFSEYMNQPLEDYGSTNMLTAEGIMEKQHAVPAGEVPVDVQKVTAHIDVQGDVFFSLLRALASVSMAT